MVDDSGADEETRKTAFLGKALECRKYEKDNPPEEIQKPLKSANLANAALRSWTRST